MEQIKKALETLGFTKSQIAALEKEDANIEEIVTSYRSDQEALFWTKKGDEKVKAAMSEKFTVFENTTKQKINKLIGLGKTRSELDPIKFEDFLSEAEGYINKKIEDATKANDETLRNELNVLKSKYSEVQNKYETDLNDWQKKLGETEKEWEKRLNQREVDLAFETATSKLPFYDPTRASGFKKLLKSEITEHYDLLPDGTIKAKDGTTATSPDGKFVFESIHSTEPEKNPLLYFANSYNLLQKSNGGGQPPRTNGDANPIGNKEFKGRAAQMMEEFGIKK
jgi:hypothetical protein